jgi:hypothetical protein
MNTAIDEFICYTEAVTALCIIKGKALPVLTYFKHYTMKAYGGMIV